MLDKSHIERWGFWMIGRTGCARRDQGGCGILAHVEDGRITMIEGD
jgi:hypothetical protein